MSNTHQAIALYPNNTRALFYLESKNDAIACWQHSPTVESTYSQAIVLCAPFGHEYTHSHRSFKHLAEFLASHGVTVFRFDYHGTGDSSGSGLEENRLQTWIENIRSVVSHAHIHFPKVSLLGFRLGASLAALAAAPETDISALILWEPIIKGKGYVRELTAIARLAESSSHKIKEWIECAGFLMTESTQEDVRAIDLTKINITASDAILLLGRDDRQYEISLKNLLQCNHNNVCEAYLPGYVEMLDEPHATEIPARAIEFIQQWLDKQKTESTPAPHSTISLTAKKIPSLSVEYNGQVLEEQPCWYQPHANLFGIISRLKEGAQAGLPAVILLNSGSVHHVGPNRIYTDAARTLAALGFCVLRLDLEGLGDSASAVPGFENHPYQPNAVDNALSAMRYLQEQGIATSFILGGICSGAYSAFHTALADVANKTNCVHSIFLINPLTFYWHEGMSLDTPQQDIQTIQDRNYYKKSIGDINKWKKLFSGNTSLPGVFKFLLNLMVLKFSIYLHDLKEVLWGEKSTLALDFNQLSQHNIHCYFIFSAGDPGLEIIKKHAFKSFKRAERKEIFSLSVIENADHTFSKKLMRDKFLHSITSIFNHIKQEFGPL